jgi:septum formation protein
VLILASGSASRLRLLGQLNVPFQVDVPDVDETPLRGEVPKMYVLRVAQDKAMAVRPRHLGAVILAADTVVTMGRRILRKAVDATEAFDQMRRLSGRRHRVYTGLVVVDGAGAIYKKLCMTHVAFKCLADWEIEAFVASRQWENVAVYEHEGLAGSFIRFMRGQPSTVKGLPLCETAQLLHGLGVYPSRSQ